MPKITFSDQQFECSTNETVLECLLRNGVDSPYSCQGGSCQTCMMRALEGTPPPDSQSGLKPTLQQQNYFLPCVCKPTQDLSVAIAGEEALPKIDAEVVEKTELSVKIMRLRLKSAQPLNYQAGQFINLHREDGLIRSYSIASCPDESFIELHVEKLDGGRMSTWIHETLAVGENVKLDGPHGDSFYLPGNPEQPMLLIGTGSGLAPLWGIARSALTQGHSGPIHLYHGSHSRDKLYLSQELTALAEETNNLEYIPCISGPDAAEGQVNGRANEIALMRHPKLGGWRVFLCGHPGMVNDTKKKAFLAGANFQDILADPFTISES